MRNSPANPRDTFRSKTGAVRVARLLPPLPPVETRQGVLRAAAVAVVLCLLVWVVAVEPGSNDISAMGTLIGCLIVLLGYVKPGGTSGTTPGAGG